MNSKQQRTANKQAVEWTKKEMLRGTRKDRTRAEAVHHVLAEVGKRWNIRT